MHGIPLRSRPALWPLGFAAGAMLLLSCTTRSGSIPDRASTLAAPSIPEIHQLLLADAFAELDRRLSAVHSDYRNRFVTDQDLRAVFRAFYDPDPTLAVKYDAWVSKFPSSYVAHLVRGIYYVRVGNAQRGNQAMDETPAQRLQAADISYAQAAADLTASIQLDSRPILSFVNAMSISRNRGDLVEARRWLDRADSVDPHNYVARAMYMSVIETRWGGNQQMMQAFLKECRAAKLSEQNMQLLESVMAEDQGWIHQFVDHDYAAAEAAYRKSAALGGDKQLANLTDVLLKQNKYREALEPLTEELAARPGAPEVLANRSAAYMQIGMQLEGLADLRAAAEGGSAYAQSELGRYYMMGIPGILTPDPRAGIEWFRKSAAQGYSAGQENLKRAQQLFGDGVSTN